MQQQQCRLARDNSVRLYDAMQQQQCRLARDDSVRLYDAMQQQQCRLASSANQARKISLSFVDLTDAFNTVWPTEVLYKLGSCRVRGQILRVLHSYLTNCSFQVYFEVSHSSVRRASSGVPQGGILSPMLFNLMMSDIPIQTGVQSCEYTDDLTFFTVHKDLHVATNKLQTQMDSLNKWLQQWGLKINCTKTKTMCFTNKRVTPLPIFFCKKPLLNKNINILE
ncbi:Reverse transcriptase domain [Trinorchestia longiramus]|nr:Reverse transcriptase domain [Trinorchestia longiramus]